MSCGRNGAGADLLGMLPDSLAASAAAVFRSPSNTFFKQVCHLVTCQCSDLQRSSSRVGIMKLLAWAPSQRAVVRLQTYPLPLHLCVQGNRKSKKQKLSLKHLGISHLNFIS